MELALEMNITKKRVFTWFRNRRKREKRENNNQIDYKLRPTTTQFNLENVPPTVQYQINDEASCYSSSSLRLNAENVQQGQTHTYNQNVAYNPGYFKVHDYNNDANANNFDRYMAPY